MSSSWAGGSSWWLDACLKGCVCEEAESVSSVVVMVGGVVEGFCVSIRRIVGVTGVGCDLGHLVGWEVVGLFVASGEVQGCGLRMSSSGQGCRGLSKRGGE